MKLRAVGTLMVGIGLTFAVTACSTPGATSGATSAPSSASAGAPAQVRTATPTPSGGAATAGPITVFYSSEQRDVYTLTAAQVGTFTGIKPTIGKIDALVAAMSEQARWKATPATSAYAEVIAKAAVRESQSLRDALTRTIESPNAKVRVYVQHNKYGTTAHMQVSDGGN